MNMVSLPELTHTIYTYPAIDNHTHPLLKEEHRNAFPFEGLISEAQGKALIEDSVNTMACYRATNQLSTLFGCENSWDAVKATRESIDYLELCKKCMSPTFIQCVLLDDGLDGEGKMCEESTWHDQFTSSPSKRIVRIEVVAQDILKGLLSSRVSSSSTNELLSNFLPKFKHSLLQSASDTQVVGFKSVACYRTGLDISLYCTESELVASLDAALSLFSETGKLRLAEKALNDHLVRTTLDVAAQCQKPVQFHTGLGDNDISLSRSTPALMQPIIAAFPNTPFVLLHSSYPFTQEAGYLTAVYPNVYLDFGEIFPFLSADGQKTVVRQVFELCPTNKIMWSTDGHWWPETYYLGTLQAREVLYDVLSDYVENGHLSESQAVAIVKRALFENANKLYNLQLTPNWPKSEQ